METEASKEHGVLINDPSRIILKEQSQWWEGNKSICSQKTINPFLIDESIIDVLSKHFGYTFKDCYLAYEEFHSFDALIEILGDAKDNNITTKEACRNLRLKHMLRNSGVYADLIIRGHKATLETLEKYINDEIPKSKGTPDVLSNFKEYVENDLISLEEKMRNKNRNASNCG